MSKVSIILLGLIFGLSVSVGIVQAEKKKPAQRKQSKDDSWVPPIIELPKLPSQTNKKLHHKKNKKLKKKIVKSVFGSADAPAM